MIGQNHHWDKATYAIGGLSAFKLTEALRLWRAKFETIKHFRRDVIIHPALKDFGEFVEEIWNSISEFTVSEALKEPNLERRRVMFDCIGVGRLFSELGPVLLDSQTIHKFRKRWDDQNKAYDYEFEDTYELYQLDGDKLFGSNAALNRRKALPVYAVRCYCTTTMREYWIYVPSDVALGAREWDRINHIPNAIRAIAWTVRIDISNPKRIYRQGDIIIAEASPDSQKIQPYHLTEEQYLQWMYSET